MKLIIIAGGKGTRLGLRDVPKPMVLIDDKPILRHQIELARKYGITEIYILLGYLPQVIINYFGDGKKYGVKINYIIEQESLGTAGAVKQLEGVINERFMVFYGDVMMNVNLEQIIKYDSNFGSDIATILVHPNNHPYDSDLVEVDGFNRVIAIHSNPHPEGEYFNNLVNAALYILSPDIFKYIRSNESSDFGRDIFPLLINKNQKIRAYRSAEYLKDMGTPERLQEVITDTMSRKVFRLNKEFKRKAIFLDRDGVINEEVGIITNPEEFKLLNGVSEAICNVNRSEYLTIVITNQPGIAKGFHSLDSLENIHKKMEYLLGVNGAYLDRIYYCPHYPEKGFIGEVMELKVDCDCRKPKTGMIIKAMIDFNIDKDSSYFIGDTTRDIKTAKNAGIKSILLETGYAGLDKKFDISPDYKFNSLNSAINFILKKIYDNK